MITKESIKDYHAKPYLTKTKLFSLLTNTPMKFKYLEEHPEPPTPAMAFGSALHKFVLEPDTFGEEFAIAPQCDRRTKEGKAIYAEFVENAKGKDIISADDMALIAEIDSAIKNHLRAKFLLSGEVETSYSWVDEATGLDCQARPDSIVKTADRIFIADLKTCTSADTDTMTAQAYKLGYDMQAAMFKEAVEKEFGLPCDFLFVCVEKEPPYLINILQADELMLQSGADRFREALGIYKDCIESGNWYGYEGKFNTVSTLSLPKWVAKDFE